MSIKINTIQRNGAALSAYKDAEALARLANAVMGAIAVPAVDADALRLALDECDGYDGAERCLSDMISKIETVLRMQRAMDCGNS